MTETIDLPLRPPRQPMRCTKWRYPDKKTARSVVNERLHGRGRGRRGRPEFLRPYFCNECHAWHLTHKQYE